MKPLRYLFVAATLFFGLAPSAQADHHFMEIEEVFLGTGTIDGGNEDVQFIELRTEALNQDQVDGHQVKLFNAGGNLVETATFNGNADNATGNNAPILAATTEAETYFGVTADVEFDAQSIRAGGKACFDSLTFGDVDCVAWGSYSGPSSGVGTPFNAAEGIPLGAAIIRTGDTNVSRADFAFTAASPQGGVTTPATKQVIQFGSPAYNISEGTTGGFDVDRENGTSGIQVVDFQTHNGTAQAGSDYVNAEPDPKLQFGNSEATKSASVTTTEDTTFEGNETVRMRLRLPTNGALLGPRLNATLTILDDDLDTVKPKSRVTKPKHNNSYDSGNLGKIKGTADDGPGTLDGVSVALRRTMTNGNCFWLTNSGWDKAACNNKMFEEASGPAVQLELPVGPDAQEVQGHQREVLYGLFGCRGQRA